MNSRHLTGHAVDLVPWIDGGLRWEDAACKKIAEAVMTAADELGVSVNWGVAMWGWDGPHFQLPRSKYPA